MISIKTRIEYDAYLMCDMPECSEMVAGHSWLSPECARKAVEKRAQEIGWKIDKQSIRMMYVCGNHIANNQQHEENTAHPHPDCCPSLCGQDDNGQLQAHNPN